MGIAPIKRSPDRADIFRKGPDAPLDELDEWHRIVVSFVASIPAIVAHELIHYEQKGEGKTLLAAAIHEGSADYIGELIFGEQINQWREAMACYTKPSCGPSSAARCKVTPALGV